MLTGKLIVKLSWERVMVHRLITLINNTHMDAGDTIRRIGYESSYNVNTL